MITTEELKEIFDDFGFDMSDSMIERCKCKTIVCGE